MQFHSRILENNRNGQEEREAIEEAEGDRAQLAQYRMIYNEYLQDGPSAALCSRLRSLNHEDDTFQTLVLELYEFLAIISPPHEQQHFGLELLDILDTLADEAEDASESKRYYRKEFDRIQLLMSAISDENPDVTVPEETDHDIVYGSTSHAHEMSSPTEVNTVITNDDEPERSQQGSGPGSQEMTRSDSGLGIERRPSLSDSKSSTPAKKKQKISHTRRLIYDHENRPQFVSGVMAFWEREKSRAPDSLDSRAITYMRRHRRAIHLYNNGMDMECIEVCRDHVADDLCNMGVQIEAYEMLIKLCQIHGLDKDESEYKKSLEDLWQPEVVDDPESRIFRC